MSARPPLNRARSFRRLALLLLLLLAALPAPPSAADPADYLYLSPVPGARLIRPQSNVIVRFGGAIDMSSVSPGMLVVTGSVSGLHSGVLDISDDGETLIFQPDAPFALAEMVSVSLMPGILTQAGADLPPLAFDFQVTPQEISGGGPIVPDRAPDTDACDPVSALDGAAAAASRDDVVRAFASPCDSFPATMPKVSVLASFDPEPGTFLITPFGQTGSTYPGHLMVVDELGLPLFWRGLRERAMDFKSQCNGHRTYIAAPEAVTLDAACGEVGRYTTGNGYSIDGHDFQLRPDGHVILMSYDQQPVRMDSVVAGGNPAAIVTGLVLQELDLAGRVVFQWRSWDHIPITDCNSGGQDLTKAKIDYIHGNAVEVDHDGHWMVSSRHLNEITKIDRQTGAILWRFGGNAKQNQFTILGDPRGFSHQHDIRRLPNGHITLHDNGNYLSPQYSRGLEYDLDEVNKIATLVWEYRNTPDTFGGFMGNTQRTANGGNVICWGGTFGVAPRLTDVKPDGTRGLELGLANGVFSYRGYRDAWTPPGLATDRSVLDFGAVRLDLADPPMLPLEVRNTSSEDMTIDCAFSTQSRYVVDASLPITLPPGGSTVLPVIFSAHTPGTFNGRLYVRSVSDSQLVAVPVDLRATVNVTGVGGPGRVAGFGLHAPRPAPVRTSTTLRFDLPVAGRATLEVWDVRGRRVATLVDGERAAGSHEVSWTPRALPDGVYFARLTAGPLKESRTIVRVR